MFEDQEGVLLSVSVVFIKMFVFIINNGFFFNFTFHFFRSQLYHEHCHEVTVI